MIRMRVSKIVLAGFLLCFSAGCDRPHNSEGDPVFRRLTGSFDKEILRIIRNMSLEEKVAMLHGNGKFWLAGSERFGIDEIQYTDGPLGIREEIGRDSWNPIGWTNDSATFFPAGTALGATWNVELAGEYGEAIGREARARGKDILLAPAINIIRTPLCGRNYEYFTEDPFLNASMAVPYIRGAQNQDVAVCVKHYAVNNQETCRGSVSVEVSERALREIYLAGFRAAVQQGQAFSVMGAYNRFRGSYLCENEYLLNKVLKGEWEFMGAVISDWGAVHSTAGAAINGLDVEMGTNGSYEDYYFADPLVRAVRDGEIDEQLIDEKVLRLLRVLYHCRKNEPSRQAGSINTPEHSDLVYRVAAEAIVLLKNSQGLLPVDTSRVRSIAVIGDNATMTFASGGFGAGVKARYEVTLLQGLQNRLGDNTIIRYARGYREQYIPGFNDDLVYGKKTDPRPDPQLMDEAGRTAGECDYAIVAVGANRRSESEGADRADMVLPYGQDELIRAVAQANPNTVVVVFAGAPYELAEVGKNSSAILWTWFNGSEGGNALADVILGSVNPSGKLPFTIPRKLEDSPPHAMNAFPGDSLIVEYKEDILVGYRWFVTKNIEPMYCFGHGKSYTTFQYADVSTDKKLYRRGETITVTLGLKNTGTRHGGEVVQVYVQDINPPVSKPVMELKAFKKVFLDPGQEAKVVQTLSVDDLAYYDESAGWTVEPGGYRILAGSSSGEIHGGVVITVK